MAEPRFPDIVNHYRALIEDGTLAPGDRMPTTREVEKKFKTTSTTVAKAYKQLQAENLIITKSGSGSFVAERPNVTVTGAARLRRISRTGQPYAPGETSTDHWVGRVSCADPEIAKRLKVETTDEIVLRRRVFRRDGKASSVGLSCIHIRALTDVPELMQERPFDRFWQEVYSERTGQEVHRSPEERSARLASNDELGALEIQLPPTVAAPVLVVVNVFHDEKGPLEVWEDVYPPGAWQVDGE